LRRIRSLLRGLPPDSLCVRLDDPISAEWDLTVEMLATLIETIDGTSWRSVMPHAKKTWRPPKAARIRRPWDPPEEEKKKGMTLGDFVRAFPQAVVIAGPPPQEIAEPEAPHTYRDAGGRLRDSRGRFVKGYADGE
jgi:hypothetical protein